MNFNSSFINQTYFQSFANSYLFKIAAAVGSYYFIKASCSVFSFVKKNFLLSKQDLKKKYGDGWVIITGGSDGIGLSFAERFLEEKFKVCIIARNPTKLQTVHENLLKKYPQAKIEVITYDFNKEYTAQDINELKQSIDKLQGDISVLINNVGLVSRGFLGDNKDEDIHSMINVNINGMIYITKICIEKMKSRERALIVGSGAIMGRLRFPTRTVYGSCKYFMESFLECIAKEYPNIDCTCLDLGPVYTNFNPVKMSFSLLPDELTTQAMTRIGRYQLTTPHFQHDMFRLMFTYFPFALNKLHQKTIQSLKKQD